MDFGGKIWREREGEGCESQEMKEESFWGIFSMFIRKNPFFSKERVCTPGKVCTRTSGVLL